MTDGNTLPLRHRFAIQIGHKRVDHTGVSDVYNFVGLVTLFTFPTTAAAAYDVVVYVV